jgi:phosphoserine phosphatase
MKKLILVDFDETLYRKDSMLVLTRTYFGRFRYFFGMCCLSPILLGYLLRVVSPTRAKTAWLRFFFGGMRKDKFESIGQHFALHTIDNDLNSSLYSYLKKEQTQATICIVTASAKEWLEAWTNQQQFDLISTHLAYQNDYLTGNLAGENCNAEEKVNRILLQYDINQFDTIEVHGYGRGDLAMHRLAKTVKHNQ